ncbi:MAG: hypothetical protein HGA96_14930 [Desulfobulbaceae bacterium]|nr:hypothetical protein [Desulfobulbaceae bacterium]
MARYSSGLFSPISEKCEGCDRVIEVSSVKYCQTYVSPEAKWKLGLCNFATHVKTEIATAKTKVNPLKASKRAMSGRK